MTGQVSRRLMRLDGPAERAAEFLAGRKRRRRFHPDAAMVSVKDHLCPNGLCHYEADGLLPRYDAHHYSAGARWVVGLLFDQMQLACVWPVRGTA